MGLGAWGGLPGLYPGPAGCLGSPGNGWGALGPDFSHHRTFVVEEGNEIWGFATLDGDYFDHLFVSSTAQRRGVATALADRVEQTAKEQGFSRISVHASLTARPFFEKRGYRMLKQQQVERFGERLTNFVMEKDR